MEVKLAVLILVLIGPVISQKLFFKSLKEDLQQNKDVPTLQDSVVPCPGGKSACADGNTCCMLITRAFGCCALPNATCCLDGKHCCPKGLKCDLGRQACISDSEDIVIPWTKTQSRQEVEQEAIKVTEILKAVQCDEFHECPTGNTCCKLPTGQWGCCPKPNAVCCDDHIHCCPQGYKCDTTTQQCHSGDLKIDWLEKKPAVKSYNQDGEPATEIDLMNEESNNRLDAVKCDKTHACENGQTCCKLASGSLGCCPIPNAVCCSDKIHCCPESTTCDVSTGKCIQGNLQIDWYKKEEALTVGKVDCDDLHYCEDGKTCCKTASGQWGCCPLPKAVCCNDHVHCCPEGTTCDVSEGKCNRGNLKIDWFTKHKSQTKSLVKSGTNWFENLPSLNMRNVMCDASHYCQDGYTCCLVGSGQWGCCPLPNAVCCDDHVHCCPSGETCDVSTGKCNQQTHNMEPIDWVEKVPALRLENVQCDASHYCQSGQTCCKLSSGQWGCCPIPNAVCCDDHVHCCPSGYTCDVSTGKCNQQTYDREPIDWVEKVPALRLEIVQCDASHYCQSGQTCCKLSSGQWGCCPIPNAVCCDDHVHCCPSGDTCDVSTGKCNQQTYNREPIDWVEKVPALRLEIVQCDASHYCQSGQTCCKLSSGQWGCCPIPNAVCCDDHVHCCPSGNTCDVSTGKCNQQTYNREPIDWVYKVPALRLEIVQCDASHYCQSGQTCCKLSSGQWGCCPIPNAVCCDDHVHCCPSGYTCDVSTGKCNQQTHNMEPIDWVEKVPALRFENVQCDASHYCQSGQTCCKLASGQWGCCPIPNAVCCDDHVHCCPSGYTCDVSTGKCNQQTYNREPIDWVEKVPALRNVQCDAAHYCPDGNTCCKLTSGQWGCCPLPNAVCCSDHIHCCPSGTTCDVSSGKCNQQTSNREPIDWVEKVPALKVDIVDCDGSHYCPDGKTCCKLASGQWGCCPLPNAVCCSDHIHCCPKGTTCDVSSGKCNEGPTQIDWFIKEEANVMIQHREPVHNDLQSNCDETDECPSFATCCKTSYGVSGCCPLRHAVCCSDGEHCCPEGYFCDASAGTCSNGNVKMEWYSKRLPISTSHNESSDQQSVIEESFEPTSVDSVICDHELECPSDHTCCKLTSGEWGCCPLPMAVCCSDGVHCCPHGYTCDASAGTCSNGNIKMEWYSKQPAILTVSKSDMVICPDGSECREGQTCCPMYEETYGCCPMPNAVCCSDGEHCCPQGYACDVSHGTCVCDTHTIAWSSTTTNKGPPLQGDKTNNDRAVNTDHASTSHVIQADRVGKGSVVKVKEDTDVDVKNGVVPCEGTSQGCPDMYTCCLNNQAQYECCPYHNAICCPDREHCCPHGYICDEEPGICRIPETKPGYKILNKIFAKKGSPLR